MLRVSALVEQLGIPTASIIGSGFARQADMVIKGLGLPLATAVYPGPLMVDSEEALARKVDDLVAPALLEGLTHGAGRDAVATAAEPEPGEVVFRGSHDEVQEYFHHRLWTDGLPIVPPTRACVDAFLAFTDRDAQDVIRAVPPEGREASIYSIAVNGVMAGCRPEYMPLLIAVVEAMCDPNFRIEDAGSTPGWEPLVIVSGPVIKQLDFNHGQGVMRAGRQANTSVGRFVRLFLRNVCGYRIPPGNGDKGSIGQTFLVALAEDEDSARDIGWPTFAEDSGFTGGDSVVTVTSVVCVSPPVYSSGDTALSHAQQLADVLGRVFSYGSNSGVKRGFWFPLIVVGPSIARVIAGEWSKDALRRFVWENATMPASLMAHFCKHTGGWTMDFGKLVAEGILPDYYAASSDPDRAIPIIVKPEHIGLVVAGDADRNQSRGYMSNNNQGTRTSRKITLPRDWDQLLARERERVSAMLARSA